MHVSFIETLAQRRWCFGRDPETVLVLQSMCVDRPAPGVPNIALAAAQCRTPQYQPEAFLPVGVSVCLGQVHSSCSRQ